MDSWAAHVADWSQPPIDDVGYVSSEKLLHVPEEELRTVVEEMRRTRYGGWRNHQNGWRRVMGLDTTRGKKVLDFGCGVGVEALELAMAGNDVAVADIAQSNVDLAERVLGLWGKKPTEKLLVSNESPYWEMPDEAIDVFYCNGVLHHVRWARQIMERAHQVLKPDGEARLMLYSDVGWTHGTGTPPPDDTENDPNFEKFVRHFDAVGQYADWYSREKLERSFGDLFDVVQFEYITPERIYLAAVLRRR